jgi:hypothetical protein
MNATKKLGLAAATVLALFIGFAAPAGASSRVEVTGGSLNTVLGAFDLTPGSQGVVPCPEKADTLTFTTTATNWTLANAFSGQFQFPAGSGNWYQADFTVLPGSGGTWSGTAPSQPLAGTIGIQVRIYQLQLSGGPLTCAKTNLRCIITGAFTLAASSAYQAGTGAPGLPTTTTGDQGVINATSAPLVTSSCSPPWNGVGGTVATLAGLQATVL